MKREHREFMAWRGVVEPYDVVCDECHGTGRKLYPSATTWRHIGVDMNEITEDVCDRCWGSGRLNRPGEDLASLYALIWSMEEEIRELKGGVTQ